MSSLKPYLEAPPLVDPTLHRTHQRLRIGYLSSEFHEHPVMHLLIGILETHDRAHFEVHAYSTGPARRDAYLEDYFRLARDLALDPAKLAMFREKLARTLPTSLLFDAVGFTRDLERLYEKIWMDHERGVRTPITEW